MASMRPGIFIVLILVALVGWFFAGVLAGGMFAVRDAAHYYYPLMQHVAHEWSAGRAPLWNPYQDLGVPLAGSGTAAAFYPGQLVFALPVSFDVAYRVYVLGHFAMALGAAWLLARHWGASADAATVAAISYAFSGSVLFQYTNVVYLVGAAWLPLALLAADRAIQAQAAWSIALGAVLAMMVLGGDPQAAYHAGLLAAIQAVWVRTPTSPHGVVSTLPKRFAVLGLAAIVAARPFRGAALADGRVLAAQRACGGHRGNGVGASSGHRQRAPGPMDRRDPRARHPARIAPRTRLSL
jgi:hypothetical protein